MQIEKADRSEVIGTSLRGAVDIGYSELVEKLGEPHDTEGDKTKAEWAFVVDGVIVTIYDYKNHGRSLHSIRDWHVGGKESDALDAAEKLLGMTVQSENW